MRGSAIYSLVGALVASMGFNVYLAHELKHPAPATGLSSRELKPAKAEPVKVEPVKTKPRSAHGKSAHGESGHKESGPLQLGGCKGGGSCRKAGCGLRVRGLTLRPGQRERLARCCKSTYRVQADLRKEIDERMNALRAELRKHPLDSKRALDLAAKVSELRGQFLRNRVESIVVVRETLTPKQALQLLKQGDDAGP